MRGGVFVLVVLLSGSRTMGEPCAPSARLDGDDDVAARVAVELTKLGVEVASTAVAAPGCPSLRAAVTRDASGAVAVTIRDRADRIEGRVVGDEALAAVWIDSWLRDDVAAPVWAPRIVPAAPPSSIEPRVVDEPVEIPAPIPSDPLAIDAGYEAGWFDDSTSSSGLSVGACARLGWICAGARVRAAWQPVLLSPDGLSGAARSDLAVLATATTSFEVGRMRVAPELGVGFGRFTTSRLVGCKMQCDPNTDPTQCTMPAPPACTPNDPTQLVGDGFRADTYTPRVAASVRVALPIFDHVWLEGTAAGQVAPGSHGPFEGMTDANGNTTPTTPGEPSAALVLGIGVRVGEP
ncbi:MAG TPA: hypothetical protein VL463_24605 [Kofleriaceae bacterium]|nr:hypothetical protein [Kofleriaceae bacterium]